MMNIRQIISVLTIIGVLILILTLFVPAFGQSGIVVNGASAVQNTTISVTHDLIDLASSMQPRIVMQYTDTVRNVNILIIPDTLQILSMQMTSRIVFEYANTNRHLLLSFPVDLIGDETPPKGSNITVKPVGETSTNITWVTDEYADSMVKCGTQSGNYTITFSDMLYVKQHLITLTDLIPGTTYYCVCGSIDLSGNAYQSQEFSFEQAEETFIHLPLVLRNK